MENRQLEFLDILNIASFCVSLMNLQENLTQSDKQELEDTLNESIQFLLTEIYTHLENQDKQLRRILEKLEVT